MNWRRTMSTIAAAAVVAVAVFAGGAGVLASPSQAPAPTLTVTQADSGRTLGLHVGDSFLLKLGEDFNWTPTVADQSIVQRVPGVLVVPGAQGIYEAERLGETDLTAVGTLNCPPGQPCPQLAILFRVHLVVHGDFQPRLVVPGLAADGAESPSFALNGTVLAGPTCPVERIPPDPRCADRPVSGAKIIVVNEAGARVADVVSDADGRFSMALSPGTYTVKPQPVPGLLGTAPPQAIQLTDTQIEVTVRYDTGIR